ncbi:acyl-CoA dehydrogenase family protein [soil metagenome]
MFNFITEEQRMIREAVQKVFAGLHAVDNDLRQRDKGRIDTASIASALAELGLFGTDTDDESMASAQVQAIVALEAGAVSLPFPVTEALAAHATALRAGSAAPMSPGAVRTLSGASGALDALPRFDGGRLEGVSRLVTFADLAERGLIEANMDGKVVVADVDLKSSGVTLEPRSCVEPEYVMGDLRFDGAAATLLQARAASNADHDHATFMRQRLALLAAAEAAGAGRHMVAMTRDYLLVRSQFGKVLGANQALKHKLADNHVRVEALTAAVEYAAAASDAGAADAESAIYAAKHFAARAGKAVADSTLQMHGAIGYTMEFPLHLYMRRVFRLGASFGNRDAVSERLFTLFGQQA